MIHHVKMNRSAWRRFRDMLGIYEFKNPARVDKFFHFTYELKNKSWYPKIHFICSYTGNSSTGEANITFHCDIRRHMTVKGDTILMQQMRNAMEEFDKSYVWIRAILHEKNNYTNGHNQHNT